MAKALELTIKRPNGKTYIIPITRIAFTSSETSNIVSFTPSQLKTYDDLSEMWMLLELPTDYTTTFTETWEINGVQISVTLRYSASSTPQHDCRINPNGPTVYLYEPMDTSSLLSPVNNIVGNSICGSYMAYDYNTHKYALIQGYQAITAANVSSAGYINLFKVYYYPDFFTHGTQISLDDIPEQNRMYYAVPSITGINNNKQILQNAQMENPYATFQPSLDKFIEWLNNRPNVDPIPVPPPLPTYPDTPDNNNEPDPPTTGDGDTSSDDIPDPPPQPLYDVNNTGFITIYNPNVTQIRELAYFMWSGDFTDLIKKMFASPFDALISLKMLFVDVPAGTSQEVWLGNVETGVSMPKVLKQFIDVDMGTITINEFFGSFADYAPFTKIQIFLPFIGYKDLNVDEVMNSNLHLRYRVDVYSGACIAFLTITKTIKSTNLNSILYQFDGNCAMELPMTQNDNSRYVAAILNSAASSAMSLAASSTFTPPTVAQGYTKAESAKLELGSLAPVANGMMDVLSTKPNVQRAGSLAGAVAAMGVKQPYIVIHRPIAQMPDDYQHYIGIPLNITRQLSTVSGYTIVSQVFMTSAVATDEEITMITELLKNGVIL